MRIVEKPLRVGRKVPSNTAGTGDVTSMTSLRWAINRTQRRHSNLPDSVVVNVTQSLTSFS